MRTLFLLLVCCLVLQLTAHPKKNKTDVPYLVVLSMDAFRWDYPEMYDTPYLDSLAKIGVRAESLQPCFPSKTFPNHYTMATGLYPDKHGIVQNTFTDPVLRDYRLGDRKAVQNADFYNGEPIWVTAEKQDIRSACFFWPGSEAPIEGIYPSVWKKYNHDTPFEARADSIVAWLQKPAEKRPHLIMWYMHEPDGIGHNHGPKSLETKETVEYLDSLVGDFCKKINRLPMADSINLVFTSDHGMGAISAKKAISLDNYIKDAWITKVKGSNPVYLFQPASEAFADSIQNVVETIKGMNCWAKEDLPQNLHYGKNERIFDLVCVAKPGWSIYWKNSEYGTGGAHGYDPVWKDMHAIFYATGPAFKKGYFQPSFENTNLYSLFAKILGLHPAKTDGNLHVVEGMLLDTDD